MHMSLGAVVHGEHADGLHHVVPALLAAGAGLAVHLLRRQHHGGRRYGQFSHRTDIVNTILSCIATIHAVTSTVGVLVRILVPALGEIACIRLGLLAFSVQCICIAFSPSATGE